LSNEGVASNARPLTRFHFKEGLLRRIQKLRALDITNKQAIYLRREEAGFNAGIRDSPRGSKKKFASFFRIDP